MVENNSVEIFYPSQPNNNQQLKTILYSFEKPLYKSQMMKMT
jgi:hypothetical protein